MRISILIFVAVLSCFVATAQVKLDLDTVYQTEPITIIATHASERMSPVTFSDLSHSEINSSILRKMCLLYYPGCLL